MNNPHHKIDTSDCRTDIQCTPFVLDCNETANMHCAISSCQTEIALVPSSSLTDLYNIITYIDQDRIDGDALRIIDIPQNTKQRPILPVSKFGLTDNSRVEGDNNLNLTEELLKISTAEETIIRNKTEEMSCQTDLMIYPHILDDDEKPVISMNSSCQTYISCSPSVSLINIVPQPQLKKNLDLDSAEQKQLYKNAAEILAEIVHDIWTIPQRIFEPTVVKPVEVKISQTSSSSTENSEWNTVMSEENSSSSHVKNISDDGMFDLIVDNSCKGDILFCRSDEDDNVSVDSTVSEVSSMPSLDYSMNANEEDLPVNAENAENAVDIESNQSNVRLTHIEEIDNKEIEKSSKELSSN